MTKLLSTSAVLLALASPAVANSQSQYMALHSSCFYPQAGETKLERVLADAFFAVMTGKVAQVTVVRNKDLDGNEYACTEVEQNAVVTLAKDEWEAQEPVPYQQGPFMTAADPDGKIVNSDKPLKLVPREYNAIASPTEAFCPQPNAEDDQALCMENQND